VDLKVPIVIVDELSDEVITSTGLLNLASGEIGRIEYQDYDFETQGLPFEHEDYEFTCGTLSVTGQYSVSASELLEIKVRAAALFAGVSGKALAAQAAARGLPEPAAPEPQPPRGKPGSGGRGGRVH
jgi:hypothetical protein